MMHMEIKHLIAQPTPLGGRARTLVERSDLRLVNLLLEPEERVNTHTAPVEVIFIIQEGSGFIKAGDDELAFKAGEIITCPPDLERSLQAGSSGADLLVIRAPNP